MTSEMSPDERRRLRLARLAIYCVPAAAGLVSISAILGLGAFRVSLRGLEMLVVYGTVFLGAVASAALVARLHPVQRGKWWRAGASFLFALVIGVVATGCFGMAITAAMFSFGRYRL